MAVELAEAVVSLIPSAKGIAGKLAAELGGPETTGAAEAAGEKASSGFASKFGGIGGKLTGVIGLAAGALGAGAVVGGLAKIGSTFDDAFDKIRVQTGATGASLDGLQDTFNTVFANVPTSADDASSAIATLSQKLGLTGQPLEDLATQVLNLSHVTGTDLNANLNATAELFNNFGVAAGEQGPKLDELFRISQSTGVSVSDLATAMSGSGAVLRSVGLNFEQSASLIGTLGKAGLDAGEVMPALGKSLAVAAKDGKSAQTVFSETFDKIRNAPSDTAAASAAMDVFGAKAGPKLAGLIKEGKLSYEDLAKSVVAGGDTINKAADDTADFPEKFKKFTNQAMVALQPLASAVFGFAGTLLEKLGPAIQAVSGWVTEHLVPAVQRLVDGFGSVLGPIIQDVIGGFQALVGAFKAGDGDVTSSGFAGVMERIGNAARTVFDWFQANWPTIKDTIAKAFEGAVGFITPLVDPLMKVGGAVIDLIKAVASLIQEHWPQIKSAFETAIPIVEKIADVVRTGVAEAMNVLGGVIKFVSQNLNDFLPGLAILIGAFTAYKVVTMAVSAATKAYAAVQKTLNVIMSLNPAVAVVIAIAALVTAFILAYKHIKPFHDAVDAVAGAVKAFVSGAIDFLVDHWKLMLGILTGPLGIAIALVVGHFDTIKNVITGVASWVGDKIGAVIGFFTGLPGQVLGALTSFPSLLLTKGTELIQGLLNGIESLVGTLTGWFTSLGGKVIGWLVDAATWLVSRGVETVTGLLTGIGQAELDLLTWFTGLGAKVIGWLIDAASWLITRGVETVGGLLAGIGQAEIDLFNWFTGLGAKVIGWLVGAVTWLVDIGKSVIQGLIDGITGAFETTFKAAINIGQWIIDHVKDGTQILIGFGEDIVKGLRDGIVNGWHWVTDKLGELVDQIPKPFRKLLHIESPSKVMADIGNNITAGLVVGLDEGIPSIADRLTGLAGLVAATPLGLNADLSVGGTGIGGLGGGLGGHTITQNFHGNVSARDAAGELAWVLKTAGR